MAYILVLIVKVKPRLIAANTLWLCYTVIVIMGVKWFHYGLAVCAKIHFHHAR